MFLESGVVSGLQAADGLHVAHQPAPFQLCSDKGSCQHGMLHKEHHADATERTAQLMPRGRSRSATVPDMFSHSVHAGEAVRGCGCGHRAHHGAGHQGGGGLRQDSGQALPAGVRGVADQQLTSACVTDCRVACPTHALCSVAAMLCQVVMCRLVFIPHCHCIVLFPVL